MIQTMRRNNHAAQERQQEQLLAQASKQRLISQFNGTGLILQHQQQQQGAGDTDYNLRTYEVTWRDINLGTTVPGSVNIPLEGRYVDVESDQVEGRSDTIPKGVIFGDDLNMELQDTDINSIIGNLLRDQVEVIQAGQRLSAGLGFKTRKSRDIVGLLRYHPVGETDTVNDIVAFCAFPKIGFTLTGERDQEQRLAVTFSTLPDKNQAPGFQYGRAGSPDIVQATPEFVSIILDQNINRAPYMSVRAISLSAGEKQRITATATFMTAGAVTFEVVGAQTTTETSIEFDTLSVPNGIKVDDFIKHNVSGERMQVVGTTYTTSTSGVFEVIRGVPDGVGSVMGDNDVVTQQIDVSSRYVRESATWASDTTASIIVGNTFGGSGDTAKGIITDGGTPGAAVVIATVNAVSSADLTYTRT